MKLLVLAHTPPPRHGQSVMVELLLKELPNQGVAVCHVDLRLSRDAADIGRWRAGKFVAAFGAALRAIICRFRYGCDTLYYVPAPPGKRGALYRDWVLMALCRPFFARLVLHWHAAGLAAWIRTHATAPERWLTQALLGHAHVALVLAPALREDADGFRARRMAVVPNGIPDPGAPSPPPSDPLFHVTFLGLGSEAKGLFEAARAVIAANQRVGAAAHEPAFLLTAAGPFADAETARRWEALAREHPDILQHIGPVDHAQRRELFAATHVLCVPTHYPAEAFPLVALEALAADRPVVATAWRGLPDIVTPDVGRIVPLFDEGALVAALMDIRQNPPPSGACRARYEALYTLERHVGALTAALKP